MNTNQLIECVPNFSEGVDMGVIHQITSEIEKVEGVRLLDFDPGKATNRTVVTFVGSPTSVIEAAFCAIKKAAELIDMSKHKGEHPRMGATDVCPLIPIKDITMEEVAKYAHALAERVGRELQIPVYMYEEAATNPERKNLAVIRSGEYEGLEQKMKDPKWKPDYGPNTFNSRSGATVVGARDFLVAYNVNINTTSTRRANSIAFDVRENGRIAVGKDGKKLMDEYGNPKRIPGSCKSVKAIGWYIEEYGIAQISMNLTNINDTPLHIAFDACCKSAQQRGLRVTGSELVGLVPKSVLIDAGKYFLQKQNRSVGISEDQIIHIAVKTLGLNELTPFEPKKKIIEYLLESDDEHPLINKSLIAFANETSSDSPAPGGGSIAAYVGTLGVALATMVANLSANKTGWDHKVSFYSKFAEEGQKLKDQLLKLVDADTNAFNGILEAMRLPKSNENEKLIRTQAIHDATIQAIETPLNVMRVSVSCLPLVKEMVKKGNPNSISDAGVGAMCIRTAVESAGLNVKINCLGFNNLEYISQVTKECEMLIATAIKEEKAILRVVHQSLA